MFKNFISHTSLANSKFATLFLILGFTLAGFFLSSSSYAQIILSAQSSARPFGLDITSPVYQAGSDSKSAEFQDNYLPIFREFINVNLTENGALQDTSSLALDPSKLSLSTQSDVRAYFIGEGAGYHNALGFNVTGNGIETGDPQLIFPDASSRNSYYQNAENTQGYRSSSYPLLPGDFADLGTHSAETQLDFFVIANGARGGTNVFSTNESFNPDGINHVISYAIEDSPYLLIGFEDLYGGGDRDFNDLVFVADIGESNVQNLILTSNPEPSTLLTLSLFSGFAYLKTRKRSVSTIAI
jgi:hypothetical protein